MPKAMGAVDVVVAKALLNLIWTYEALLASALLAILGAWQTPRAPQPASSLLRGSGAVFDSRLRRRACKLGWQAFVKHSSE